MDDKDHLFLLYFLTYSFCGSDEISLLKILTEIKVDLAVYQKAFNSITKCIMDIKFHKNLKFANFKLLILKDNVIL